jgi:AraC-like DNA-binding protein
MRSLRLSGEVGLLLGGLGTVQAIYLVFISYLERVKNSRNLLLCLLVLMLCLRVVKSLLWMYWSQTPDWILNIGFFAHSTTGPLLVLYTYQFIFKKGWAHPDLLHFIPSFLLLGLTFTASLENFWYAGGYSALLFHQISYSLVAIVMVGYARARSRATGIVVSGKELSWITILVLSTFLLQAAYFTNYILGITPYILAPIVFSGLVYTLSFFALLHPEIFRTVRSSQKYSNINLSDNDVIDYRDCIIDFMHNTSPYLHSTYTLNDLAKDINLPSYLVSHIINSQFEKNFPDFINSFRIKHAQKLLKSKEYQMMKISSVAYDSGFNSLSVFNSAFKRHTGMTPSEYKEQR